MLKRRLIPKLQLKATRFGGREQMVLVTTRRFSGITEIGSPISQARIYQAQAADELVFLDLDATGHGRATMVDMVRKAAEQIFMPITVGGGVQSLADVRLMLENGADKVSINTAAFHNPTLIEEASKCFGSQCVVVSIDFRCDGGNKPLVYTHSGKTATGRDVVDWALEAERRGAGELLITSIDRDGMREGLDITTTSEVARAVGIPVIASGGCGLASHFVDGFLKGHADAVAAGTFFCHRDQNPMQCRAHIKNAGIPVRMHL